MKPPGPILIVDDEDDLRRLLDLNLRREGFETLTAATGAEALEHVRTCQPELVVLDLMLPDMPGTEVCRRIRASPHLATTPIIMLTAKGEEIDRVVGFEVGADDYVVKASFSMREFVLRVRAVLRRNAAGVAPSPPEAAVVDALMFGPLAIDQAGHRVFVDGAEVSLTATEFKLLHALAAHPGQVQSRGNLLQDVWDMPPDLNTRTVDTHVKRLREKLGAAARHLETVRGVGYRFNAAPGE
ncbi:MAG: two-component system phosphate regulon response regulator PhoB [Myxococcota bacterium]|jgi:two-component system phosphate regulon response regulator PhoB